MRLLCALRLRLRLSVCRKNKNFRFALQDVSWLNTAIGLMDFGATTFPLRPAWVEIDLGRLRRNLQLIRRDLPRPVRLMAVLKDEAYGHGALDVVRIALEE